MVKDLIYEMLVEWTWAQPGAGEGTGGEESRGRENRVVTTGQGGASPLGQCLHQLGTICSSLCGHSELTRL